MTSSCNRPNIGELRARLHALHGPVLHRLRTVSATDAGTTEGRSTTGGQPATALFTSLLDPAVEVTVIATNIPLERLPRLTGHYPDLSRMIIVTVAGHDSRTGHAVDLDPREADAWATALAPAHFEQYVLRLGVMTGSTGRTVHYRHILGPDTHICAIDDRDRTLMTTAYRSQ